MKSLIQLLLKHLLSFVIVFTCTLHILKAQNFEWAKSMGGISPDIPESIVTDNAGNVYTTGSIKGAADFDPGIEEHKLYPLGEISAFISKLDANGNFIWAKQIGGSKAWGRSIILDKEGNVYVVGTFRGRNDFDPGVGEYFLSTIYEDVNHMFICKLDSSGEFLWAKAIGNSVGQIICESATMDSVGNLYATGYFYGTPDFNPGIDTFTLAALNGADIFISKLDSSGNFIWAKSIEGSGLYETGASITTDIQGNSYTTGYFMETADFNSNAGTFYLTSNGSEDIFILKLDANGNLVWAKNHGGMGKDRGTSISIDKSGNIYTTGYFVQTANFNSSNLTSKGGFDVFISKLNTAGNLIWAKSIGGDDDDEGQGIICDDWGNIYISGSFQGTADFDPGNSLFNISSVNRTADVYICRLNSSGNFGWVRTMGGIGMYDLNTALTNDKRGNIYVTGHFGDSADFDPGETSFYLNSNGQNDVFITKLNSINTGVKYLSPFTPSIKLYPNPSNGIFTMVVNGGGSYINFTITDILGKIVYSNRYLVQTKIDLSNQPNGTYFIQLKTENEIVTRKLIIAK